MGQDNKLQIFLPAMPDEWQRLLDGKGPDTWKTEMVGHWHPPLGRLWFNPPRPQTGGYETFGSYEALQTRYYELFETLKMQGRLRSARLGVGTGSIQDVHSWSERD